VAKVNIDTIRKRRSLGVMSIPTLLLFKEGKVLDTLIGLVRERWRRHPQGPVGIKGDNGWRNKGISGAADGRISALGCKIWLPWGKKWKWPVDPGGLYQQGLQDYKSGDYKRL